MRKKLVLSCVMLALLPLLFCSFPQHIYTIEIIDNVRHGYNQMLARRNSPEFAPEIISNIGKVDAHRRVICSCITPVLVK